MNGERTLDHIEEKLDTHINQHNEDYRKLVYWAIGILLSMVGTLSTWFVTYGALEEKVNNLEEQQANYVSRDEFDGLTNLINEKFFNLNDKIDDIRKALNIR